jgi:hypothetical protein
VKVAGDLKIGETVTINCRQTDAQKKACRPIESKNAACETGSQAAGTESSIR